MNARQFEDFAASGYNRIPVFRAVNLTITPDEFLSLLKTPNRALLTFRDEVNHQVSILALSAAETISYQDRIITVKKAQSIQQQFEIDTIPPINPLDWLSDYNSYYKTPRVSELPHFTGGLIGYIGETLCEFTTEKKYSGTSNQLPDFSFIVCDDFLVINHDSGKVWLMTYIDPIISHAFDKATQRLIALAEQLTYNIEQSHSLNKKIGQVQDDGFSLFSENYKQCTLPAYFIHFDNYYLFGFGKNSLKKFKQNMTLDYLPTTWPALNVNQAHVQESKKACQRKLSALCLSEEFHTDNKSIYSLLPPEFSAIDMIKAVMPHPLQYIAENPNVLEKYFPQQHGLIGMLSWHDDFIGQFCFNTWLSHEELLSVANTVMMEAND